ncbi:copper resistance protein [Helicobacter sp. 12S02232-10]|uniref:FixH family protein n=1 Tax=Helicobacter sp. 12S02232-10 TaxID=1476197 RepID=UPI000BA6495F|nr:FixH family protein [Helicobacter sp. 12S02232-10]PAF48302.1 copper resistance protein [Helicobacter sp. 12S02232-10]
MKHLKIISIIVLVWATWLGAWEQNLKTKDLDLQIKSIGNPVSGENTFILIPNANGSSLKGAKMRVRFIMPEMSGMPAMNETAQITEKDGSYEAKVNLPMNGTWQIRIDIEFNGKIYKNKTSIDL